MNTSTFSTKNKTENWYIDDLFGQVDVRIDIVRMDVYRQFIGAKSENDYYLAELFNNFISAAQHPLNFAILDGENEILFHMATDIKYYDTINKQLKVKKFRRKFSIPFLPQLFFGKYRIVVFSMSTKISERSNWIHPIHIDLDEQESIDASITPIENENRYLERCVWRFFCADWDGFRTLLKHKAARSIEKSIESIATNFYDGSLADLDAAWPPKNVDLVDEIRNNQSEEDINRFWYDSLRKVFYPIMRDSASGLEAQHYMMHKDGESRPEEDRTLLPNMLVSYRSFTRSHKRRRWGNKKENSYLYDSQFLIEDREDGSHCRIMNFFQDLKILSENDIGLSEFEAGSDRHGRARVLYKDVILSEASIEKIESHFDNPARALEKFQSLTEKLDDIFWNKVLLEDHVYWKSILSSPVGDNARSLVDPCYFTGLIHTNPIFEVGGLDRFYDLFEEDIEDFDFDEFLDKNYNDLIRIVMMYYIFCEMSDWGGGYEDFDPSKLNAVLVPIKMRGSVWAVTIHTAYKGGEPSKNYQDVPYWISYYHITSTLYQKNRILFDKFLWDKAKQRISNLLENCISDCGKISDFANAMENFNRLVLLEQKYFPYALPQIVLDGGEYDEVTRLYPSDKNSPKVAWRLSENKFFGAMQKWDRKGTRSFHTAMEIGLNRGLERFAVS